LIYVEQQLFGALTLLVGHVWNKEVSSSWWLTKLPYSRHAQSFFTHSALAQLMQSASLLRQICPDVSPSVTLW